MKRIIINVLHRIGLTIREDPQKLLMDMDAAFIPIWNKSRAYTMTSTERMYGLYKAAEYISKERIRGDVVECGVWRGGSAMVAAYTLRKMGDITRKLYLYDTYTGMAEPDSRDRTILGNAPAHDIWLQAQKARVNTWCLATLDEVKKNLYKTGYPKQKIRFIKGKVEDTIPNIIPDKIAILRLDTDWYTSTYHELVYLYPRLVPGGVLIIDDYGHWQGARKAVDTYMREHKISLLLHRLDYAGRIAIKTTVLKGRR